MWALALGLLGVATSDLVAGPAARLAAGRAPDGGGEARRATTEVVLARRSRWIRAVAGVAAVLLAAWGTGVFAGDLATVVPAVLLATLLVVGWQGACAVGQDRPWVPLATLVVGTVALLLLGGPGSAGGGAVGRWLEWVGLPGLAGLSADRALLLVALLLMQLSTANVVVRLVLRQVDINPPATDDPNALQGGRVLGPMERLLILGLGLAGEVTAASVVIAAKGLIRWPELSRTRSRSAATPERPFGQDPEPPSIHDVTEYFLVGSFVSWLIALGSLALAHLG